MKVLVVGGTGAIGQGVVAALSADHEVIVVSRAGDHRVDITDPDSITRLYESVGQLDAVTCTAGVTPFKPLPDLTRGDFLDGLGDKLLGQIELVRQGLDRLTDGGSFTLIAGITSHDPIPTGAVAGTVSGAIEAFVRCAAIELPRGLRINAVSPTVLEESWDAYGSSFPGYKPTPVVEVGRAFLKSVAGAQTGQIYRVGY